MAGVSAGLAAAELSVVRSLTERAVAFRAAGASVITLAAADRIDGCSCDRLAELPGVRAAGALRDSGRGVSAATLPSSSIPVFEVTPVFAAILPAERAAITGLLVSDQVAEALAVRAGDSIATEDGPVGVAGVYGYPSDGRRPCYGYAALAPAGDSDAFDECWIDVWPLSSDIPKLLHTTLLPTQADDERPVLSQLNTTRGASFEGETLFAGRITQYGGPVALALGAGLGFVAVRSRRMHLASALHAGVSRADLAAITALETVVWVIPCLVFTAAVIGVFAAGGADADAVTTAILGGRIGLLAAAGVLLGTAAGFGLVRERHLFRYFADR
ncbi:hypothetical protein [Leifsonia xyli]|uniref:hypothetical protein n=1 Tax=Leifsonia xyli TaxID=1575 RepID=UPI001CB7FEB3|nr:hypothetical protein [Leifsonia xyli]